MLHLCSANLFPPSSPNVSTPTFSKNNLLTKLVQSCVHNENTKIVVENSCLVQKQFLGCLPLWTAAKITALHMPKFSHCVPTCHSFHHLSLTSHRPSFCQHFLSDGHQEVAFLAYLDLQALRCSFERRLHLTRPQSAQNLDVERA